MILFSNPHEIPSPLRYPAVTIGNFDGVHLGHREIFRRVKESAREIGGVSVIITFDPHPLRVVPSGRAVRLINTFEEKVRLIEASGVDYLVVIPFDLNFASITAEEFVEKILVRTIGVKKLIIGHDYAFGKGREGNVELLKRMGLRFSFEVDELAPIASNGVIYSSSLIRSMIRSGAVAEVVRFLGRHFSLLGTVVHGAHRGKGLGFPTANIIPGKELIPAQGVYAVKVKIADSLFDAACNIGENPTFGSSEISIEVFIFDFDKELYGQDIRIYFINRIRNEKRFNSPEELKKAISEDVASCRLILEQTPLIMYSEYLEGV
jgi:riboflavin kinase/FMN adenylyltransferase